MIGRRRPSNSDLVALADGSLAGSRRARVERAVAASPDLQADLAAQRRALHAIAAASDERAPGALRARLELARRPRGQRHRYRPAFASATVAVAALAAGAAIVLAGGPASAPTVASAATLSTRPALAPAGVPEDDSVTLPSPHAAGLAYPNWARRFGFTADGVRTDRLAGRLATTVFYTGAGQQIAYTIVSGRPLLAGVPMRETELGGTQLSSFPAQGRVVVTWLRGDHTCVLSGSPALLGKMLRLAAWKLPGEYSR